jgi:ABC-2 type transport system permease protein
MRLYFEVARVTARRLRAYRVATVAGIVTNTVFGYILAYVLVAAVRDGPVASVGAGGFGAEDAATFTFVGQGMLMVVGIFGTLEMAERVMTGEVALELAKPYDYQAWWAAVAFGKAAFYLWARGIAPFALGALAFDLRLPPDAWLWPAFLLAVALAVGLAFAWGFLLQMTAFWIVDVRGPNQLGWVTSQLLAGTFVPLALFPDGAERLVRLLPFASMMQVPVEVFLGDHRGLDLLAAYGVQAAWLAALVALGRVVLARAERRVVIHGG